MADVRRFTINAQRAVVGTVPAVRCIATDEEAERLFGPWARGMVSAVERRYPPVAVFNLTAGVCSRCGAPCSSQMVRYAPSTGKADALCGTCLTREAEMRSPDWFAAEERATR